MKKEPFLAMSIFLLVPTLVHWGCVKGGPALPYDLPLPTPTPVSGALEAGVIDNGSPVMGVTVLAVDPNGDTLTAVTDSFGKVAYDPNPLLVGTWDLIVPTQGRYFNSIIPVTVSGGGSYSVTFTAGGQTLQVTPTTAETYGSSNTELRYSLAYSQPNNLKVPVTIGIQPYDAVTKTGIPSPWGKSINPVVLGNGVDTSAVTLTKTGCYLSDFPFDFTATDFSGTQMPFQAPRTITRGFTIPLLLNLSGNVSGNTFHCVYDWSLDFNFSSTGDCNYTYPLHILIKSSSSMGATLVNKSVNIINGGSQTVTFSTANISSIYLTSDLTGPVTTYSATTTLSGFCVASPPAYNQVLINTSY